MPHHSPHSSVACCFTRTRSSLLRRLSYSCWKTPGIISNNPFPSYKMLRLEIESISQSSVVDSAMGCGATAGSTSWRGPSLYWVTLSKSIPHTRPIFSIAK